MTEGPRATTALACCLSAGLVLVPEIGVTNHESPGRGATCRENVESVPILLDPSAEPPGPEGDAAFPTVRDRQAAETPALAGDSRSIRSAPAPSSSTVILSGNSPAASTAADLCYAPGRPHLAQAPADRRRREFASSIESGSNPGHC